MEPLSTSSWKAWESGRLLVPEKRVTPQQRLAVTGRAQGCCEYCRSQERFAPQNFTIDHIMPQSQGGQTTLENLALACQGCNSHKHARTVAIDPGTSKAVPLYSPRLQRWPDHFSWNEDFALITGLTPTGRATVQALKFNDRDGLLNMRRILYLAGAHPPSEPNLNDLNSHKN